MRSVLGELPVPTRVACDVRTALDDAPRLYGPQKGASPEAIAELERRLRADAELQPYAELPGSGAAGGLGAAFAALGAELVPGAPLVLETIGFAERIRGADVVVTGEGVVDRTTAEGKAPAEVARIARAEAIRCVCFGGRVEQPLPGVETVSLSGDPTRARADLATLAKQLLYPKRP
jgi:glycerate kinase